MGSMDENRLDEYPMYRKGGIPSLRVFLVVCGFTLKEGNAFQDRRTYSAVLCEERRVSREEPGPLIRAEPT